MDQIPAITENINQFLTSLGYIAVPFRQNVAGLLLINAKINDVDGVYILDSGAGQTVVDAKQLDTLKLKLNYDETALTGGGVGAHSIENVPSYNNKIEINNFKIDNLVVAVMSLETAWESLARVGAQDEVFGIIGVDILKTGNAIVDFSTMTLYLMQP
ncbi:MAG TPA: aspartyl protease family protein [Chitinophagaceae bacterium]|nr:aspartyl protease family protein [Chitinophagaceae bacterium]